MSSRLVLYLLALLCLILMWVVASWSENIQLLDCGTVKFFGQDCPVEETPDSVLHPPPPPPAYPLFPRETLAPDTPPLFRELLDAPTVEKARMFLDWQQRRMDRITEVQELLKILQHEEHATKGAHAEE